jgi:hypothetical protein
MYGLASVGSPDFDYVVTTEIGPGSPVGWTDSPDGSRTRLFEIENLAC